MDDAKIYNVCLQRVRHQILSARQRSCSGRHILESYCTGDAEEIIDLLEIYDIEDRSPEALNARLDDLAYTVSLLVKEKISFEYDEKGHLGLYLVVREKDEVLQTSCNILAASAA
jgi:hypothetical protein